MEQRAGDWWTRIWAFLSEGMWRAELEPRTWTARGVALLQFAVMVGEGFVRHNLLLRASALTYFAVLSIVPLLAIVGAILTALGVTESVVEPLVRQFAAGSPDAQQKLLEVVQNADIRGLGTLGAAALFLTTVLGISNVERALNHIWGVKQERPWSRRLPDYLAVLVVAPILLGAALSLATTMKSQWIVQKLIEYQAFAMVYDTGLQQMPKVFMALAFGFVYWFLPNTSVRLMAALLGGVVAALLVDTALGVYLGFSVGMARANALYGGFAQLPLLLVWIYFVSAIALLGAEIAFAYQNLELYRREVRGERAGPAEREAIGLRIVLEVGRAFRDSRAPWTADELADTLRVPVRTVRDVLAPLQEANIVAGLDASEKENAFQLGRPAERIEVVDVLAALRGPREPVAGDAVVTQTVETLLAELAEGEAKTAGGQSLAQVLACIPPADGAPSAER
ncbi:MAG: YihY family inner membrane protein [Deltaproteobacteria bacterium]|nr:YihY family inner membrane protein [Deltaproteobacteria bacterium]